MDGKQISLDGIVTFTLHAQIFISNAERAPKNDQFNNLFIKNFPSLDFSEDDLRKLFETFGSLCSVKIDESRVFGFVAYNKGEDAQSALAHYTKLSEEDDYKGLYVTKCQKKEDRARLLRKDTLKFMKDLARNNLYFKGFPIDGVTQIPDLTEELKGFFAKFGEVKSLKLMQHTVKVSDASRDELLGFGFVSFQTLEATQKARFDVAKEKFRGVHQIIVN